MLIDWGLCTFKNPITNLNYQSIFDYGDYMEDYMELKGPHTGTVDFFLLITFIIKFTSRKRNDEEKKIYDFCTYEAESFLQTNFLNNFSQPISFKFNEFHLFAFLRKEEKNNQNAHIHNLTNVSKLTYRKLFEKWITDNDNKLLTDNIIKLNSKDFFKIPNSDKKSIMKQQIKYLYPSPSPRKQQINRKEEICLCMNKSKGKRCENKAKPGLDFCGIHKNCEDKFQRQPSPQTQINRKEEICLCMNQSKGKRCENKAKPGINFCGIHRKCQNMI